MEKEKLLEMLETLHADLSTADKVDPEAETLLRSVTDDIERLLDDQQESPEADSTSLSGELNSMVLSWEAENPRIGRLLEQAAAALGNLGI
jgi:predicted component of type VI protein secretion system